jgi:diguanylate cyclase (GGDEF)-like protein
MGPTNSVKEVVGKILPIFLAGVLGVLLTGVVDYVTGYEMRLFPLYFLPIAFVAWRLSRPYALALSALSSATWAFSNFLAGRVYASPFTWPVNIVSQLVAFGAVGILVSDLRRRLLAEEDLNRQDPLTALLNSRAFYERGDMLLAITRRYAKPFTIAYMDLDNFKEINDMRGHMEGDRTLKEAARVLKTHFRSSDLVARLGGDEFAVLLFNTGADAARLSLNRVRDLLVAAMSRNGWPVTVSVGAASYASAPPTLNEAIHLADSLMYQAKRQGKNRVCIEAATVTPTGDA